MSHKIKTLIENYQSRIDNINWHIKTNNPEASVISELQSTLSDYNQFINELK